MPAVIYGRKSAPQNLEINLKEIVTLMHHAATENLLVDLAVDRSGSKRLALVQEVQHHPLSGAVLHLDLHEVAENEKVTITVPVEAKGEAAGVKTGGGVLEHVLFKLKVRALPKDLPESIVIDVTPLEIGAAIHIKDLTLPEGVTAMGNPEISILHVTAPTVEEVAAPAAEGAAAKEPEVLKEKKPEAGADAAAGDKKDAKPAAKK